MKNEILHLIAQSETRKAIDALLQTTLLLDEGLHQEVSLQSAKYEQFKKDERSGVKSSENLEVRLNRINAALIEIVQKIVEEKTEKLAGSKTEIHNKKKHSKQPLIVLFLLLVIASAIGVGWIILPKLGLSRKNEKVESDRDTMVHATNDALSNDQTTIKNKPPAKVEKKYSPVKADGQHSQSSKTSQTSIYSQKDSIAETQPQPFYDRKLETVEGMTRIKKGRYLSFLDLNGVWIGFWYDDAENFHDGMAYVKLKNRFFWIDKTGQCIKDCD